MVDISRRNALILGGVGVGGVAIGGTAFVVNQKKGRRAASEDAPGVALVQPEELRSSGGVLTVSLESSSQKVSIAGRDVRALSYNGGVPGPTLRVRAGDTLNISLRNGLADPSNLHVHGLHVSPENNGDNMFVMIEAGASFDYQYKLPTNHPPGVYWYHPHHHGYVADQVFGGLYGAIIVEDPEEIAATHSHSEYQLAASGDGRRAEVVRCRLVGYRGQFDAAGRDHCERSQRNIDRGSRATTHHSAAHHAVGCAAVVGESSKRGRADATGHQKVGTIARGQDDFVNIAGRFEPTGVDAEEGELLPVESKPQIAGGARVDEPPAFTLACASAQCGGELPVD